MPCHFKELRMLALVSALSAFATTGAVAADLVCNKCVDTSDIAQRAITTTRIAPGAIRFGKLNAPLQTRITDLEAAAATSTNFT